MDRNKQNLKHPNCGIIANLNIATANVLCRMIQLGSVVIIVTLLLKLRNLIIGCFCIWVGFAACRYLGDLIGIALGNAVLYTAGKPAEPVRLAGSPNIDYDMKFTFEEIQVGPVKINFPFPEGSTHTAKSVIVGEYDALFLKIKRNGKVLLSLFINLDIIEKDTPVLLKHYKAFELMALNDGALDRNIIQFLENMGVNDSERGPTTLEYDSDKGYYFRTFFRFTHNAITYSPSVINTSLMVDDYFLIFMMVDYSAADEEEQAFVPSWFYNLLKRNHND